MKLFKNIVCAVLTLVIVASSGVFANAQTKKVATIKKQYHLSSPKYNTGLENALTSAWDNYKKSVDISKYKVSFDEFNDVFNYICDIYPEYFYLDYDKIQYSSNDGYYVSNITLGYIDSNDELDKQRAQLDNAVDNILSKMSGINSDEDRIVFFHDYIGTHNAYDPDGLKDDVDAVDEYSFTAYGALVNNFSVCQGMSDAFLLLCKKVGIECYMANSESMVHAWNLVKINGRFYHLDITWDDNVSGQGLIYDSAVDSAEFLDLKGFISHDYFIKSDSQMISLDHEGWDNIKNAIDSKTYKNHYWDGVNSSIYYIKGAQYYIKNSEIIKRNPITGAETVLYTIKAKNSTFNSSDGFTYAWDSKNVVLGYNFKDYYLLINLPDGIYAFDLTNNETKKVLNYTSSGFIAGFNIEDNEIEYDVANVKNDHAYKIADQTTTINLPKQNLVYGDVDNSGGFDISDILLLRKYLVGCNVEINQFNGDVNNDNSIDLKDMLLMCKKLADGE